MFAVTHAEIVTDQVDRFYGLRHFGFLGAIPLRKGTTELIRAFAGQFDQMHRHRERAFLTLHTMIYCIDTSALN